MSIHLLKYRGHIRNWKQLCEILHIDKTLSRDKREEQILIKGYEKWGTDIGKHLIGMFAFALQDRERTVAVRDHFGTKPFYYYITEQNQLLYGTFIREILTQPGFKKELNEEMLQIYLTLTYAGGENTFFRGIKKLMPGHVLVFEAKKLEIRKYWTPEFAPDDSQSLEEYAEELHRLAKQIMEELQEETLNVGSFLSSGVDSSYLAALSHAKKVYSCGYDDPRFDESILAEKTAQVLGADIDRFLVSPEEYFAEVPYFCEHMEQPLADASGIAYSIACRETVKTSDICYSGEGCDEFFGGYRMYANAQKYRDHLDEFYVGNTMIMKEEEKRELLQNYRENLLPIDIVKECYQQIREYDPLSKMLRVDIETWLEGDIFLNVDKMSTACGLEVRMPMMDVRVFELASRIPPEYKVTESENKLTLRTAANKVLPREIAFRKKMGFPVPIRIWLSDARYNQKVRKTLFGATAGKFFRVEKIREMFEAYLAGESDLWRKIWTIYIFLVWYEKYFAENETKVPENMAQSLFLWDLGFRS